jgi:hypothetical protein
MSYHFLKVGNFFRQLKIGRHHDVGTTYAELYFFELLTLSIIQKKHVDIYSKIKKQDQNKITSKRHYTVTQNCLSRKNGHFSVIKPKRGMREIQQGEQAYQETILMIRCKNEFFGSLDFFYFFGNEKSNTYAYAQCATPSKSNFRYFWPMQKVTHLPYER